MPKLSAHLHSSRWVCRPVWALPAPVRPPQAHQSLQFHDARSGIHRPPRANSIIRRAVLAVAHHGVAVLPLDHPSRVHFGCVAHPNLQSVGIGPARAVLLPWPDHSGSTRPNGAMRATSAARGTTWFISSRKTSCASS